MLIASFKNENKNEINYIYKDENNNFIGLNINKDGIGNFDYESFNHFITNIKFNNNCIKVNKYEGYDVYYNPLTNYNHYIKDGKEDLLMFYLKNGNDGLLYKDMDKKNKKRNSVIKKLCVIGITLTLSFSSICLLSSLPITSIINYNSYNNSSNDYSYVLSYDDVSAEDYIDKIMTSSYLSQEEKEVLANKQLLEDLKPYYDNSYMKNLINYKLNNINIKYFDNNSANKNKSGYYNQFDLNTINLNDEFRNQRLEVSGQRSRYSAFTHEYIHLLQANGKYTYIDEAVADIVSNEYLNNHYITNKEVVKNIKLLIDIIGPEPILEYSFGGNSKSLENILADHLPFKDFKRVLFNLIKKPNELSDEDNAYLNTTFCNLYKNMYGKDIREDKDILYDYLYSNADIYSSSKIYLNKSKMSDNESYHVVYQVGEKDKLLNKNLIIYNEKKIFKKEISLEEYLKKRYLNNIRIDFLTSDISLCDDDLYYKDRLITIEDAYKLGYIRFYEQKIIDADEIIPDGYELKINIGYYDTKFDNIHFTKESVDTMIFSIESKGIKSRFNVNYNNQNKKRVLM